MKGFYKNRGSITLETAIILPIFLMIFLFVYGTFSLVSAQNQISHALVQTAKSVSLDAYLTENVASAAEQATEFWDDLADMVIDISRISNSKYYTSATDWYKQSTGSPTVVKDRFIGFFSGGDELLASEKLNNLGVVNGLAGISVETTISGEELIITVKYNLEFIFDFWGYGVLPMEHTIKTRLWM